MTKIRKRALRTTSGLLVLALVFILIGRWTAGVSSNRDGYADVAPVTAAAAAISEMAASATQHAVRLGSLRATAPAPPPVTVGDPTTLPVRSFPSVSSVGVAAGTPLQSWSWSLQTSKGSPTGSETHGGLTCKVFEGFDVSVSNGFLEVDDPCVVFRNTRFTTQTRVPNTSALVQQSGSNRLLIIEDSNFDGGPYHERGVQADLHDLIVRRSGFVRFGNAAIEMNNRDGSASLTVEDSYLYESKGWQQEAHADGIQVGGGRNVTIRHNTVLIELWGGAANDVSYVSNSALGLWAELGDVTGTVTVDNNVLAGGGRVVYLEQKSPFAFRGPVVVRDNIFDVRLSSKGGVWGPLYPDRLPADLTWTNNIFSDGRTLSVQQALSDYP